MRISDWSSDVCSSDLARDFPAPIIRQLAAQAKGALPGVGFLKELAGPRLGETPLDEDDVLPGRIGRVARRDRQIAQRARRRNLVRLAEGIKEFAERLDIVGQVIVSEEGRADTFNRANRVEDWVDRKSTRLNSST